jgi:hypothetical protein
MDTAVSLVQAYLYANGYFTVTEYPILEQIGTDAPRTVTDIDILAVRFPGAGAINESASTSGITLEPDPELDLSEEMIDVIIGEVKEGAAELNKAARDPAVLTAVCGRIGRISPEIAEQVVADLIRTGTAIHPAGIRLRQMVFASRPPSRKNVAYTWIRLGRITIWMRDRIRDHWDSMKAIQSKDPALSFMLLREKAERGED